MKKKLVLVVFEADCEDCGDNGIAYQESKGGE